jgi:C4-dicarboxylate-specific signal transduction histidine kinase
LRTFGRPAPVTLEAVDVDEVIERSLLLMQEQLRLRGIEVELDLCSDELIVLGNAIQLEQVFINLLTNARDALAESRGKTIRIGTSREGDSIKIRFADTGSGIPREVEQRIFDPFFTTKEVGTGTGLGLSITYSIVKEHGGQISVEQGRSRGASFLIELPYMTEPPAEEPLL